MINVKELKKQTEGISILYVEDDSQLRKDTERLLRTLFDDVECALHGKEALDKYMQRSFDILITDIHMPVMDGIELTRKVKTANRQQIVVITSAHDESRYLLELINLGADYFVLKPLAVDQFLVILEKSIRFVRLERMEKDYTKNLEETVAKRTAELKDALTLVRDLGEEIVYRLTAAAEYRDTDTGEHIRRIGMYAETLARKLGLTEDFIESIKFAAPLHDIGKIGIPDTILLKSGPLTTAEYEIMKTHTTIGARMLEGSRLAKINMIERISLLHHERWDGTGYPYGREGDAIPPEAIIVNICDQYDALRSRRPYKQAFDHATACSILTEGDGRTEPAHFAPKVLAAFKETAGIFDELFQSMKT